MNITVNRRKCDLTNIAKNVIQIRYDSLGSVTIIGLDFVDVYSVSELAGIRLESGEHDGTNQIVVTYSDIIVPPTCINITSIEFDTDSFTVTDNKYKEVFSFSDVVTFTIWEI